jgi:hypothetical protein
MRPYACESFHELVDSSTNPPKLQCNSPALRREKQSWHLATTSLWRRPRKSVAESAALGK